MKSLFRPALTLLLSFTLLTGVAYPLAVTGLSQILWSHQANGSLIRRGDRIVGSEWIGQSFSRPELFWGRPSATSPFAYNAASSSGSNLGPSNPLLGEAIAARVKTLRQFPTSQSKVPIDLLTTSASGLDPHVSPASIYFQLPRVARARGMSESTLRRVVEHSVESRTWGFWGEPRVNVLRLNLELDGQSSPQNAEIELRR